MTQKFSFLSDNITLKCPDFVDKCQAVAVLNTIEGIKISKLGYDGRVIIDASNTTKNHEEIREMTCKACISCHMKNR